MEVPAIKACAEEVRIKKMNGDGRILVRAKWNQKPLLRVMAEANQHKKKLIVMLKRIAAIVRAEIGLD